MGMDATAAEEVSQEVLMTVWRRAATYDPAQAAASTWIYTIARNRVIDRWRRQRHIEVDPADPAFLPATTDDADDRIDANRRAERLRAALGELPSEQAEVLRVSYFEGKSQTAVADQLDVPLGTVKSRTRLALARLRTVLQEAT